MTRCTTSRLAFAGRGLAMALSLSLSLSASVAAAATTTIDFDSLPSLSDVATASLPGVSISSALVASETDAATLTGFDTSAFASSGVNGLLNLYGGGTISITFATPVQHVGWSLTVFPLTTTSADAIFAVWYFVGGGVSAPDEISTGVLPDAEHFLRVGQDIGFGTDIERVDLYTGSQSPSTFFLDDLRFTPIPEPGTMLCVAAGLVALAIRRR